MQTINAYYNGNAFVPLDKPKIKLNQKVIVTIPDELAAKKDEDRERRAAWLKELDEAIMLSLDEELPLKYF